jgi:hypothetical protein
MGATLGVTIMGVIVNHGLPPGVGDDELTSVHRLPEQARSTLADAIRPAFFTAACVSTIVWLIAVRYVHEQRLRRSLDEVSAADAAAGTPATAGIDSEVT